MLEIKYPFDHEWHVSINKLMNPDVDFKSMQFMYEAKKMALEVPRMTKLFAMERLGELPQTHKQCSHASTEQIKNVLTCCRGVKCSDCEYLKALEDTERSTPEEIDTAKAWTCASHIVQGGGDMMNEGYILTTSDRMFWDRTHESLAAGIADANETP